MRRSAMTAALAALLVGGCAAAPETVDRQAALEALTAAATAYQQAATDKDRDAVVAFYAADALMVPPAAALVEGLAGVEAYRFGFIETDGVELDFELVRVALSEAGDIGWTLAIGDITIARPEGPPGRDVVRDLHTWQRQGDGSWKIVVDMWNSGVVDEG